jgi:ribokinase
MPKHIAVVGSINLDLVASVNRTPTTGETVSGNFFQTFFGGKGANQAVAVARLGHPVSMIGKVGNDEFGRRLRGGLKQQHVDVRAVGTASRTSTGVALISIDAQGQNSIVVIPGANGKLSPRDVAKASAVIRSAGMILTQLEIPLETVEYLATVARRYGVPLLLDPAPARQLSSRLLEAVTWLTPNETETSTLSDANVEAVDPATAGRLASRLLRRGPRNVVIKMGCQGAYIAGEDTIETMIPPFRVQAIDSTAAGDAFNAGLAVALLRGEDPIGAARFASAVAALSVTRKGAQPSMPSRWEVTRFLNRTHDGMNTAEVRAQ